MKVYSDEQGWPCTSNNRIKACFCVGPENCEDKNCPLVKKFLENGAKEFKENKECPNTEQSMK